MINKYFTNAEVAEELGIDEGTVEDLIAGKGIWTTEDIDRLLDKLAAKLTEQMREQKNRGD